MQLWHSLLAAISFLTRLPVCVPQNMDMSAVLPRSMRWFPLVGLLLGGLATAAALLVAPALRGLVYMLALLWLTRGLHWDGFADLCDAAGSGATGDKFGQILKDSRLGAFGGMGLVAGLGAQAVLASHAPWLVLVLAPVAGRCIVLPLMMLNESRAESTLCRLMAPGASFAWAVAHGSLPVLLAFTLGSHSAAVFAVLAVLILYWLSATARKTGGINGDFLGTGIIACELAYLFAATT